MVRKNIKVGEDLFERMKADKGPHKSWPQYFEDQLSEDAGGVDAEGFAEVVDRELDGVENHIDANTSHVNDRLDRIEAAAREAATAAQSAQKSVEELQR